jgi:hypothetical protein
MRCDQAQDHLRVSEMEKKPVNGVQPFDGKRAYMTSVQRIQGQPEKTQADLYDCKDDHAACTHCSRNE